MLEQITQDLIQWIRLLPPVSIYLVFFLVAYIENVVPPIPGDILVAFGGYLVAEAVVDLLPLYLLTTFASVVGFMSMYWLGARWGGRLQEKQGDYWLVRFIPLEYVNKVQDWMRRWGQGVVLANRFLAGTRSVIALTAGISQTKPIYTALSSTVSSLLWNGILLGLGWLLHRNWRVMGDYLSIYGRIILVLLVLIVVVRFGISYYKKKKQAQR
jgi:membrane protein DedA with SNARE-associated domain